MRRRNGGFHDKGLEGASHHAVIPNVNTIGDLGEIWPRLSGDEKKLFDAIARSYLASVMPDYRYRQTTVTLDVRGFAFRAAGRQPIEAGWREAFPDWRPAEEKGEEAQALPVLRDGETARLRDPEGYTKSAAVCRAFLELHAPDRTTRSAERNGAAGTLPPSAAQVSYAEAIARERDITVPDEARACSAAMSKWIDVNKPAKPATGRRAPAHKSRDQAAKGKTARARAQRRRKPGNAAEGAAPSAGARAEAPTGTPLRIPYGNKEAAFALGARYASGGWYAPPGVDLSAFRERGWL